MKIPPPWLTEGDVEEHTQHIVLFSGGLTSWATAKRVAERHGTDSLTLLFCDTKMEDEDLYRFLGEAAADVGGTLVQIADGRTPWEIFFAERMMGNHLVDPCSKILKRQLGMRWLKEHCDPAHTVVYLGFDWTEITRWERARQSWAPWTVEAPLCESPYLARWELNERLQAAGIAIPRLYEWATHNNCGGFCIKAGQGHFIRLLVNMPDRYRFHEEQEQRFREFIGKDVSILQDRTGGVSRRLTLRDLRLRYEAGRECDMFDIGGCGCMEERAVVAMVDMHWPMAHRETVPEVAS